VRLDRLIEKIKLVDDQQVASPFERIARAQYADGRIDLDTLRLLVTAHREKWSVAMKPGLSLAG